MSAPERQQAESEETARGVLGLVRDLTLELHPHKRRDLVVELDSGLDRDLGFDSLSRVELFSQLERRFRVRLPESMLAEASTPRDLVNAILTGGEAEPLSAGAELRPLTLGQVSSTPDSASTLVEVLDWHVETHADRTHLLLYGEGDREEEIRYGDLRAGALRIAAGLQARGLAPGDSVSLMLPTSRGFFETFFGILYAGGVPVPIYPPFRPAQLEDHLRRQSTILGNAQARLLVAPPEARAIAGLLRSRVSTLRSVETVEDLRGVSSATGPAAASEEQTALIQYTSGSTGDPKGVVLSHANLLANIRAMGRVLQVDASDVFVSWLPLYHDMGLIGAWLGSLYHAVPVVVLSPLRFLSRPESWLWAMHRHRGTLSASPNFGYELCVRKVEDADIEGLDLSSWRAALNGAEPVSPSTLQHFTERYRSKGFRPEAMAPVYGLAESSVGLCFPPYGRGPVIDRVDRTVLTTRGVATPVASDQPDTIEFVACGQPLPGHQVRIVDESDRELPERQQGRLQFRGPSCTRHYFRNEEKTAALFDGPWLESGDLAYVAGGDVFLTGRTKDVIIRAGRNVYPHELEEAIGDLPGVRKGCVVVFASVDPRSQVEKLIVVAETRETDPDGLDALRARVEEQAGALLETPPDDVVLAPPRSLLKTSSGKIRRAACCEQYERGALGHRAGPVWWQAVRFAGAVVTGRLHEAARRARETLYAGWWWATLSLCVALAGVLVRVLPGPRWRWPVIHRAARLALWLSRTPRDVSGAENLPGDDGVIVVNHSNYFDVVALTAAIPGACCFVAKQELSTQFFSGTFLRRLGAIFVDRFELQTGVEDTNRVLEAARAGSRVVAFPEGTLHRMPGLLPFKLGAFLVAARAEAPVVPVAVRGTRSILRSDQWFPRAGRIRVQIGKPIQATGTDWSAAIYLRDRARAEILWMCGEPDLQEERVID